MGLTVGGQFDRDRARRERGIDLDGLGGESQESELPQHLPPQFIAAECEQHFAH